MTHYTDLIGLTLTSFNVKDEDRMLLMQTDDGRTFTQFHQQDCCEDVHIESICGDVEDILGSPIISAEEVTSRGTKPANLDEVTDLVLARLDGTDPETYTDESHTWTFYKIDTAKGGITIRWLAQSSGYYSEEVSMEEL